MCSTSAKQNNDKRTYSLNGTEPLQSKSLVKDLGVWFSEDLKFSHHCASVSKTASCRAALIKKHFVSGDVKTLIWAFKTYVRPILEYASPVWSPYLFKDIDLIESVQRRFTKSLKSLNKLPYNERLRVAGLESLELRRLKCDLCLTFSLLHGLVDFDYTTLFELRHGDRTRGHHLKLVVRSTKLNCFKYFFANRVVPAWNSLPTEVHVTSNLQKALMTH